MDRDDVISNLEQQIRWIEEIECHKFPGWLNVTNAIRDALAMLKEQQQLIWELQDQVEYLTDKQKEQKFFLDESGKITPLPVVVRCKDCKHYDKDMIYCNKFGIQNIDNDWFCADGEKSD